MNKADQKRFRQRLEALRSRTRDDAAMVTEQALSPSGGQAVGELSNAPMHLGDMGTDEFLHDINATLVENEQYLIGEVNDALERLDQGTFGKCENCGRPIAADRLEAIPYARLCIECASNEEHTPQVSYESGRPHRPEDTIAPEGEMGEGGSAKKSGSPRGVSNNDRDDRYAAGEPGGGGATGGLAGTVAPDGEPDVAQLQHGAGGGRIDKASSRRPKGKR